MGWPRNLQKSGGPPPRANHSSHSPAADRRSTRLPLSSPGAALSHTARFPRPAGFMETCSARLSSQDLLCPRSEERPTLQPAFLCLTTHAAHQVERTAALPRRAENVTPETAKGSAPNWCGALTMCSPWLKRTRPRPGAETATAGVVHGELRRRRPRTQQRLCTATAHPGRTCAHKGRWWLCAGGPVGPVVQMCAGKAAERVGFCRAHVGEGHAYSAPVTPSSVDGEFSSDVRVVAGFRRRAAAPDSSPSFFSSSGLHPSLVART